jgi:membrane fusion protein, multidrug efflux system
MQNRHLFFCLILLFVVGCSKEEAPKPRGVPVEIGVTTVEDVPQFLRGVGQFVCSVEVNLKAQVSGTLTKIHFLDGDRAEEGDLLMTIDPRIYEAQLQQSIAQLAEDKAKLRYALNFAETYGALVGKDYVARLDYEQAIQDVDTFKAAIESDLAAIKHAETALGFTQLRAPCKGYLGMHTYDEGNYIDTAAGTPLVALRQITPLIVRFFLPAEWLQEIREQQQITPLYLEAQLPGDPAHPLQGSVCFIDTHVNSGTGMITLKGTIPNEDERGWPGQFVRVYLRLKTLTDAVLVPKKAVILGAAGNFVYVLDEQNMRVELRMIGKGFAYKDSYVVLWGLQGGEKVVVDGQLNLQDQALVSIP